LRVLLSIDEIIAMEHQSLSQPVGATATVRGARGVSPTARAWLFLTPSMLFLAVLIVASLLVLRMSVGTKGAEWSGFSLDSYAQLLEPYYLKSLLLTLRLALISALIAVILAIPVALHHVAAEVAIRATDFPRGSVAAAAGQSVAAKLWLAGDSRPGGHAQPDAHGTRADQTPDHDVVQPERRIDGAGANRVSRWPCCRLPAPCAVSRAVTKRPLQPSAPVVFRCFAKWCLPMSLPGIITGATLVFAYNASSFVVPLLLGGRRVPMLAVMVHDQIAPLMNWPAASPPAVVVDRHHTGDHDPF
jgi:putative spermidine/putrescine transport system permease protein